VAAGLPPSRPIDGATPATAIEAAAARPPRLAEVEVVATNFKRRLSGVTTTIERVVPAQARSVGIATLGPGLARDLPRIRFRDLPRLWRRPAGRPFRIWHARRNTEMLPGILLRDLLRMPLRLVFTSASQRHHTAWTRWLISRMDGVISTSAKTAAYLRRESTVVRHGIDTSRFTPCGGPERLRALRRELGLPSGRLVGCFGRIRAQKGTDAFVDAMLEVLPTRPDAIAVVLGRATQAHLGFLASLRSKATAAGLADRILFPGEVSPAETARWYRALDLFVAPQRWEGFGVTPLEAMASGVPVVATRVGAFEELLVQRDAAPDAEETGILVPPGDGPAIAAAVAAFLDDPPRLAAAGLAARRHAAQHFSIESEAAAINAVYESLWAAAKA
jgi:mannosyltransferase